MSWAEDKIYMNIIGIDEVGKFVTFEAISAPKSSIKWPDLLLPK